MKFLEILSACVIAGRNVKPGELIPIETVKPADLAILCGSNFAAIVDRYPVEPEKSKKAKKK